MVGEKDSVLPKSRRGNAVRRRSSRRKDNNKTISTNKSKSKYRWVWMIKNEDELYWREYAKSLVWFNSYLSCKENALEQDLHVPSCAAVRLYIEIKNRGYFNVVEVLCCNDPEEEAFFADDEDEEEDNTIKYKWEWQINYPTDKIWRSYIKPDKWFTKWEDCLNDVKNVSVDVVCSAALRLCVQIWHGKECILEVFYKEGEL